jgi:hypothetical protein
MQGWTIELGGSSKGRVRVWRFFGCQIGWAVDLGDCLHQSTAAMCCCDGAAVRTRHTSDDGHTSTHGAFTCHSPIRCPEGPIRPLCLPMDPCTLL